MKNWELALAAAVKRRGKRYRTALKRCQRKGSTHAIHESRISARRLTAQFNLLRSFAPAKIVDDALAELKRHLAIFNPLRDAQVQLSILERVGDSSGVSLLRKLTKKRERRCRRKAADRIREVKTRRIRRAVRTIEKRMERRGREPQFREHDYKSIVRGIDAAFARVVERRKRMSADDATAIHRERVAFKRFRYAMESARLACPGITAAHFKRMSAVQDRLGALQDIEVFLARLDKLVSKAKVDARRIASFRAWLLRRREAQMKACIDRADEIFTFWPVAQAIECAHPRTISK